MATDTTANDPKLTNKTGKELGASGTMIFHGYITAEDYNRDLVGKAGIRQYDIMRRSDPTVHATLHVCKLPILATTWDIEAVDKEDDAEVYKADFIRQELFKRNVVFHDVLREALTLFDFGHSVFEKVYELTEFGGKTRIGIAKIASRKQSTILNWAQEDGTPGVTQQLIGASGGYLISIPIEKLIVFSNEKEGDNYEGISLLRYAYKPWSIKDTLDIVNAIALERQAVGIPVLTTDMNGETSNLEDVAKAELVLQNIRANESSYIKKNNSMTVEFMDMKGQTTKDVIPTIQYHDRQIVRSVLAQFLELGGNGKAGGSRALSEDHSQLFEKSLQAVAKTIVATLQNDLVKQLCDMNFTDMSKGYPKIIVGDIGDEDITQMGEAVNKLMTAGALTADPDMEDHIRDVLHFPKLPQDKRDDFDILHPMPPAPGTPGTVSVTDPSNIDTSGTNPSVKPDSLGKDGKNPKDVKATALINEARAVRKRIINVMYED